MSDERRTILIIDDDDDVRTYLESLFLDRGFEPLTAAGGERGLELARRRAPDLICLDIVMPEKTGVRVYRELRDNPDLRTIPIVIVTGVPQQFKQFISRRKHYPAPDGYVSKPFDVQELVSVVEEILAS